MSLPLERRLLPDNGNWRRGRGASRVDMIVIHVIGGQTGTIGSAENWFRNPDANVSAHYGNGRDGNIVQWVDEDDTAFHAGKIVRPSSSLVKARPKLNPNDYSIGIENEGTGEQLPTLKQTQSLVALVRDIASRWDIPINRTHIVGHNEIRADKVCPGKIDVDEIVRIALASTLPAPKPGDRRWSPFLRRYIILTRYVSDTDWSFISERELGRLGDVASAPWSALPTDSP